MISSHKQLFIGFGLISIVFFVFSLAALPWVLARIPADYFMHIGRAKSGKVPASFGRMLAKGAKNLAGMILVCGGFIMLFVPGQGLLTLLAGMMLMDFPGKNNLILLVVKRPRIQQGLNWIRDKRQVPRFRFPV